MVLSSPFLTTLLKSTKIMYCLGFILDIHNDLVVAFDTPEKQILIDPVFAQFVQATCSKALYGFDVLLSNTDSLAFIGTAYLPSWLDAINNGNNFLSI